MQKSNKARTLHDGHESKMIYLQGTKNASVLQATLECYINALTMLLKHYNLIASFWLKRHLASKFTPWVNRLATITRECCGTIDTEGCILRYWGWTLASHGRQATPGQF